MPDNACLLKRDPLGMAFAELSRAMDDPFDSFHAPDTIALDPYDPTKPCYLFTIPREVRDMIYDIAISSGDINILRASRKLYDEGNELLYKLRVYHFDLSLARWKPEFELQNPIAALIQNVNIRIMLIDDLTPGDWLASGRYAHSRPWGRQMKTIRKFSASIVARQTCQVELCFLFSAYTWSSHPPCKRLPEWFISCLQTLIGFSRIILKAHRGTHTDATDLQCWPPWQKTVAERAGEPLRDGLGPGTWHDADDPDCGYLEFHPREHWEANHGGLLPMVQRTQ